MTRSVSVVVPSYNEKETVAEAIDRITASVGDRLEEIIVVDDNSPDGTSRIVEELRHPRLRLIRRLGERGLASALARGTREAKAPLIVWLDCDMGVPPEAIPRLLERLDGHDVAIGSRYVVGGRDTRSWWRVFMSVLLNGFARAVLGSQVRDYTSGFAAVKREVLAKVPLSEKGFGDYFIEWAHRCVKARCRIVEVGYVYSLREKGTSKTDSNPLKFSKLGVQYWLRVITARFSR